MLATALAISLPVLVLLPHDVHEEGPLAVLNKNLADITLPGLLLLLLINGAAQTAVFFFLRKHCVLVFIGAVFAIWSAFSWWSWLSYL